MNDAQHLRNASSYTTRLDRTLKALQDRVKEQEALLEELRLANQPLAIEPSQDPKSHLRQIRGLKAAYDSLVPAEPWLPAPESPLPALLALRNTDICIRETQEAIAQTTQRLKATTQYLEKERADLADAKLIQSSIQARIASLQEDIEEQTQKSPEKNAKDMIRKIQLQKDYYDDETGKMVKAFNSFIGDHLAVMLAAEELGGPIAGDEQDIDEALFDGGYTAQGKAKKAKASTNTNKKRQRRIDEIWGDRPAEDKGREEPWSEKRAAAEEMRWLTEQLLNSSAESRGSGPGAYVDLPRESAAARFLVRSKIAQFHPKDARKLRLLDFGGELDD